MEAETSSDPSRPKRQQLSKGMEHMRSVVTVPASPIKPKATSSAPSTTPAIQPTAARSSSHETDVQTFLSRNEPVRLPPQRSHDPSDNLKRTDPFRFGSRYLEEGDDVFEFNAWDHVDTDNAYREFAEQQYAKQREAPASEFDRDRFNADPSRWWDLFYRNNATNFFKDRRWLFQEFPLLAHLTTAAAPPATILEIGAGAGNTAFPLLAANANPALRVHAVDFSPRAVDLIRNHSAFDPALMRADVWDLASDSLPPGITPNSVDVVVLVFTLSALAPAQWPAAVRNVRAALRPGGAVLLRDYGRGDLAQVRFRTGRWMGENFYARGDGTRVYFFGDEELARVWGGERGVGVVRERREKGERERRGGGGRDVVRDEEGGDGVGVGTDKEGDGAFAMEGLNAAVDGVDASSVGDDDNAAIDGGSAFEVQDFGVDRRMLVNRQRKLKMYRCWMQALLRKPVREGDEDVSVVTKLKGSKVASSMTASGS